MEDTFVLRVQMQHEGVQSLIELAATLRATAERMEQMKVNSSYGYVVDEDGKQVGEWEVQ